MDTTTRLLRLIGLLGARAAWSGDDLAERLGVTPRTVRRDIARLRGLDYPVEAVPGPHGGYRLGRGRDVPPLSLDDQEALAVALGLQMATQAADGLENAAASALAKLERVLPRRLGDQLRSVQDATVAAPLHGSTRTDPEQLLVLAQACRARERVRFVYVTRDEVTSMRHVEPSRLVHTAQRWYLVAFDLDRDAWRSFRVDRLRSSLGTGVACATRELPDAIDLVRRARTVGPYPVQVLVRLHVPLNRALDLVHADAGALEAESDETTLWRLGGSDPGWIASWVATTRCSLEILDPPEVRAAFDDHVHRLRPPGPGLGPVASTPGRHGPLASTRTGGEEPPT